MEKKSNLKTSAFGLAKGAELLSDDNFAVQSFNDITVAILCDGVGSAKEGREASRRTVEYFINNFKLKPQAWTIPQALEQFTNSINNILYSESQMNYQKPEFLTTLTIIVIDGNRLYGANIGDSRIYLLRDTKLFQLSTDHIINEKNKTHILTKVVGISDRIEPYIFENNLEEQDHILLCSDGLYTEMSEDEIIEKIPLLANGIVKYVNNKMYENLRDDTSAIVVKYIKDDEVAIRKRQILTIPESLSENETIDKFTLIKPLIQNRRTWLASENGQDFVLKFPDIEAIDSEEILNLFIREAWNGRRIESDFFPKAFIPEDRTYRYYVMEIFDGENLENILNEKGTFDTVSALEILKTLLLSSQYLLKLDLVNGDIKPDNMIRLKNGDFRLVDYGSIVEIFSINSKAGTPSYLAPERFKGSAISEQSEIFSMGVTIYRLLTKKYPYGEIEPFQTPSFHSKPISVSEQNDTVPEWFSIVVLRMIHSNTEIRYKYFSEVLFDIENSDKVEPIYSKDSPLLERDPLKFYKIGFWIMLAVNIFQFI